MQARYVVTVALMCTALGVPAMAQNAVQNHPLTEPTPPVRSITGVRAMPQAETNATPMPLPVLTQEQLLREWPHLVAPKPLPKDAFALFRKQLTAEQTRRIARTKGKIASRAAAMQRAGGWQKFYADAMKKQAQSAASPMSRQQMAAALEYLNHFVECQRPGIADVVSEFIGVSDSFQGPTESPIDLDLVVEPTANIFIDGCLFGADAGEVRLVVNPATGGFIDLPVTTWSDNTIEVTMPPHPGYLDQPAQVVVIKKGGTSTDPSTTSDPIGVQFVQRRVLDFFDPGSHRDALAGASTNATTKDELVVLLMAGGGSEIAGQHYTFCCNVVNGTDRWLVKLKNGWQIPTPGTTQQIPLHDNVVEVFTRGPQGGFFLNYDAGWTGCGLFGSWDGWITSITFAVPSDFPKFQQEVDVGWQIGSNCSGLTYNGTILIYGPEGVPYD